MATLREQLEHAREALDAANGRVEQLENYLSAQIDDDMDILESPEEDDSEDDEASEEAA